jgi:hypothetical protein
MKVIRYAVDPKTAPVHPTEVTVLCLLLTCIEGHRNDHERAFTHLRSAISIVRDNETRAGVVDDSIKALFKRMYRRLIVNALDLGRPRTDMMVNRGDSPYRDLSSITRQICDQFLFQFASLAAEDQRVAQRLSLKMLDETEAIMYADSDDVFHRCYLLYQSSIVRLVLQNIHRPRHSMFALSTKSWDQFFEHHERFIMANDRGSVKLGSQLVTQIRFGFGSELNLELFFVACEAVDFSIRLKAIAFLRQFCRREKYWDSYHAASIAEWLMTKETLQRISEGTFEIANYNHLLLTHLALYVDNVGISSTFCRPSWARAQIEGEDSVGFYWIHIEDARFGPVSSLKSPPVSKLRLCYESDTPFWPSLAKIIGQAPLWDREDVPF